MALLKLCFLWTLAIAPLGLPVAAQHPLLPNPSLEFPTSYGNKLALGNSPPLAGFTAPEQSLHELSEEEFTVLSHPAFPGVGARVKRAKGFCDPTVRAYTGYIDVDEGAKHLFFYFFESRNDPAKDDVVLWVQGGPGGSSAVGLFMELGPCSIDTTGQGKNGTIFNPYSWNDKANLFFLDQPVGVGFSYADFGEVVATTEEAAKNVAAFMYIFFETFGFKGRPFHMAGESYGGRYIPLFASEIVDRNKRASADGLTPINMKSVMIGNGNTDFVSVAHGYYEMACTNASLPPVLDISTCVRMKRALPRCEKMLQEGCRTEFDELACTAAMLFCGSEISAPLYASGRNPYDLSEECEGSVGDSLCYPITKKIADYLNRPETRSLLGVDPTPANFSLSSRPVSELFGRTLDREHQGTTYFISGLLERGVKVLIYAGSYDWVCSWVANARWVETLEWSGQSAFNAQELKEWTVDGHVAGLTKGAKGLTFATVQGAGHMVPYNKPIESLAMVNRWLESLAL